jgi:hypothetical protein
MVDMPATELQRLQNLRHRAGRASLPLALQLVRLMGALQAAGLRPLALKGPTFATQFYPQGAWRPSHDLDIFVQFEELDAATQVLGVMGYTITERHLRALELRHGATGGIVELHFEFDDDPRMLPLDLLQPFAHAHTVLLANHPVPTLTREAALVLAIQHGCKHFWRRLFWLGDIAQAMVNPSVDWPLAANLARQVGVDRQMGFALLLAERTLGVPVPAALRLHQPKMMRGLGPLLGAIPPVWELPCPQSDSATRHRLGWRWFLRLGIGLYSRPAARMAALDVILRPSIAQRRAGWWALLGRVLGHLIGRK